jgi:hypothetical protein
MGLKKDILNIRPQKEILKEEILKFKEKVDFLRKK